MIIPQVESCAFPKKSMLACSACSWGGNGVIVSNSLYRLSFVMYCPVNAISVFERMIVSSRFQAWPTIGTDPSFTRTWPYRNAKRCVPVPWPFANTFTALPDARFAIGGLLVSKDLKRVLLSFFGVTCVTHSIFTASGPGTRQLNSLLSVIVGFYYFFLVETISASATRKTTPSVLRKNGTY